MPRAPSWAISFADLALLLLAFFVALHSGRERVVLASAREALTGTRSPAALVRPADHLFEPGEARLRPTSHAALVAMGRAASHVRIESRGFDPAGRRLDRWEVAAARAAAVARARGEGGLAEDRIELDIPPLAGAPGEGQQLSISTTPRR